MLGLPFRVGAQPFAKTAVAVRVAGESPRVDGRLDDSAWQLAQPVSDFAQQRPLEMVDPTERTEVPL